MHLADVGCLCCRLAKFAEIFADEVQVLEESEQCWPQAPNLQY